MKTSKDRIFDEIIEHAISKADEAMEEYDWYHEDEKPDIWDEEYDDYLDDREYEKNSKIREYIEEYMEYDLDIYDLYELMGYDEDDEEQADLINRNTYYTRDFDNSVREAYQYYERTLENEKLKTEDQEKYDKLFSVTYSNDGLTLLEVGEKYTGKLLVNCKYISEDAFLNAECVSEIEICEGVESIPDDLFTGCKSVEKIKLPSTVTDIGVGAFEDCDQLEEVILSPNITQIKDRCFSGCAKLKRINIPYSIESFGYKAFNGCEKLKDIPFGNNLKHIGERAFAFTAIDWLRLPNSLETCGGDAFMFTNIESLDFPPRVNINGSFSLSHCEYLRNIKIPIGVIEIRKDTFENCVAIEFIYIPYSVKKIEIGCLNDCQNLKLVQFDRDNCNIQETNGILYNIIEGKKTPFYYPHSLSEITISDRDSIIYGEFESRKNLKKVCIDEGVKVIRKRAFALCDTLDEVIIPKSTTSIEAESFYLAKINRISLPSMSCVNRKAFDYAQINTLIINGDDTYLTDSYFFDLRVNSVVLPKTITNISYRAFSGNIWIKEIHFTSRDPYSINIEGKSGFNCFSNLLSHIDVFVPKGLLNSYQNLFGYCYNVTFHEE